MRSGKHFFLMAALLCISALYGKPYCRVNRIPQGLSVIPWEKSVEMTGFSKVVSLKYAQEQTSLKLLHDGKFLYGLITSQQRDKTNGSRVRDDLMIWSNNGCELFFVNARGDVRQVLINSEGTVTDQLHKNIPGQGKKADISWSPVKILRAVKKAAWWQVEFKIPLAALDFDKSGFCRFNVVRNNYRRQEFSSWTPLAKYSWFQEDKFGTIELESAVGSSCGVTWEKMPTLKLNNVTRLKLSADKKATALLTLNFGGKNRVVRTIRLDPARKMTAVEVTSREGGKDCEMTLQLGGKTLYRHITRPKGLFIDIHTTKEYFLSTVKEMPTRIFWNQIHTYPKADPRRGLRVRQDYQILFDMPRGVTVQNAKTLGVSPKGKNRYIAAVSEKYAYSAADWLQSMIYTTLPAGTKGRIWYRVKKGSYLQDEQYFDFSVEAFRPVAPPKNIPVYFYNYFPRGVKDAEKVRRFGINTILYNGFDVPLAKSYLKNGFYMIRGGYYWPGSEVNGYMKWPKFDRDARAHDINGHTIYGRQDTPQFSPSYRGKFFQEAVKKERAFAWATGIRHYSFDMEECIMPNAKLACFRPESIARFKKWFAKKYPGKKWISPKVFERDAKKYPLYHRAWTEFRDFLFADFFNEFKRQLGNVPDPGRSVPWKGVNVSEWSFPLLTPKSIFETMRGPEFLKAFSWFERDAYSSADRNIRSLLHLRGRLEKLYPHIKVNLILCPSPERLDLYSKPGDNNYYGSPAPKLPDELKYKIFDGIAFGCRGIALFNYPRMTSRAWRNLTEALRAVNRVEHIVSHGNGIPIKGLSVPQPLGVRPEVRFYNSTFILKNQPKILVHGIRHKNESIVAVSEYWDLKHIEVPVTFPGKKAAVVYDAETGAKIASLTAKKRIFKVKLDQRRCRLFHIIEK